MGPLFVLPERERFFNAEGAEAAERERERRSGTTPWLDSG
jgi:hypothetical protein